LIATLAELIATLAELIATLAELIANLAELIATLAIAALIAIRNRRRRRSGSRSRLSQCSPRPDDGAHHHDHARQQVFLQRRL
jgi:hypothetical protein